MRDYIPLAELLETVGASCFEEAAEIMCEDPQRLVDALVSAGRLKQLEGTVSYYQVVKPHEHLWRLLETPEIISFPYYHVSVCWACGCGERRATETPLKVPT